jgi:nicotinate-nucleotide pyrophosphorylase (carboxylating)
LGLTDFEIDLSELDEMINKALQEDIGPGDITTVSIIPDSSLAKAKFISKDTGILAGLDVAKRVFELLDETLIWQPAKKDGDRIQNGDVLVEFKASNRAILSGERTALNFVQRMSGIATKTSRYVEAVKDYKTEIIDTRKTVPGLRMLDKYSVKTGGGTNHRIGLFDMVMLKENHIRIAGGISKAVDQVRSSIEAGIKIEVETTNLSEVKEALNKNVDIIMLDNMTNSQMSEAVKLINGQVKIEASGEMNLQRVKEVAALGVDYISVGALTHSVEAFDISQQVV